MKADLIERLRAHPNKFIGHWEDWANEADTLLREAAAALEAEASEGERLRAALEAVAQHEDSSWFGPDGEKSRRASWRGVMRKVRRALIPEAPAREGWQPISSAPKDGTNVIVAEPDGNVTIARWLDRDESWWELNNDSTGVWGFALNAVQWRPLPPPPPPSQDREG